MDAPPEGFPTMSLDSEDEDWDATDTSHDEEITHKLFSDLNRDLLDLSGDGRAIVISDSEEEEHEDDHANVDAAQSSRRVPQLHPPLRPMTMAHPIGWKMIVVAMGPRMKLTLPRRLHRGNHHQGARAGTEELKKNGFALLRHKFFCKGEW
jgi:hypothetical protein